MRIEMQQAEWDYLLTQFLLVYGSMPLNDILRRTRAASGRQEDGEQQPLVMTAAALASMAWFVYGFFAVSWWLPLIGTIVVVMLWVVVTPTSFRYSRSAMRVCTLLSLFGLLNVALTLYLHFN